LFGVGSAGDAQEFRTKRQLDGKTIVAHSGNMGVKQGLDIVLDAALRLKDQPDIAFLLAGDGAMKSQLENRASALRLNNLQFLPLQESAQYLKMLAAVDIALIVQQATVADIAFPSKTVTLLSAGRPVAAAVSANSEIGRVIRVSGGGVLTEPEEASALANTIGELYRDPQRRMAMGESGRRYAYIHWNEEHVLSGLESHLLNLQTMRRKIVSEALSPDASTRV
jgi:colanic acid biosynthesis glycosyl transferase WcaI